MKNYIMLGLILMCVFAVGCKVEKPIGGETDEHGCLGPAGYTWNKDINACVREWELNDNQKQAAKIAVAYVGYTKGLTILKVDVARCPGCFVVELEKDSDRINVNLEDWQVVESPPQEQGLSPEECIDKGGRTVNIVGGDSCDEDEINIGQVVGFISPNICCIPRVGEVMTLEEAMTIAEGSECLQQGQLTEKSFYNEDTDTWWIDLDPYTEKPGCNPACVVSEATKRAEINWRCTGVLPP